MVTKTKMSAEKVTSKPAQTAKEMAAAYKESAQQIWLAGLGAFSKAQEQGGKVFNTLVKDGQALQQKTQSIAKDKLAGVTAKANAMRDEMMSKSNGQWGKLESLFEERVSKALKTMGLPTQADIAELHKRIDALSAGKTAPAKAAAAPAKKAPTKAPAKAPATAAVKASTVKAAAVKKSSTKAAAANWPVVKPTAKKL
jgi:poly(hydroxyalkanoate) granule-associated protein